MLRETDKSLVLSAALELANTQLLAQNEDEAGLDAQARALIAFDGAILGVMVAAKALVGLLWFLPLVATLASILVCLALDDEPSGDVGPNAWFFYLEFGDSGRAREQLLGELRLAFESNARRIRTKEGCVRLARGVLLAGLLLAGVLSLGDPLIRITSNV